MKTYMFLHHYNRALFCAHSPWQISTPLLTCLLTISITYLCAVPVVCHPVLWLLTSCLQTILPTHLSPPDSADWAIYRHPATVELQFPAWCVSAAHGAGSLAISLMLLSAHILSNNGFLLCFVNILPFWLPKSDLNGLMSMVWNTQVT